VPNCMLGRNGSVTQECAIELSLWLSCQLAGAAAIEIKLGGAKDV